MKADFRDHPLFSEAKRLTEAWLRPGTGEVTTLGELSSSPDGSRVAAAASLCEALEGPLKRDGTSVTRIAIVDMATGDQDILTHGPGSDSLPRWSPVGNMIAYLSDREQANINRLRIFDIASRSDRPTPAVEGFVESIEWAPDGRSILLGVAGYGSDLAGIQGAFAVEYDDGALPDWSPEVRGVPEAEPWRSLWIYDLDSNSVRQITQPGVNIWQGVWCGPGKVAAICSDLPEETHWYAADVRLIDIATGEARTLFRPEYQLGWLAASPSGATIAVAEAICSDRNIVMGDLRLIDAASAAVTRPATLGGDVVQLFWRGDDALLFVAIDGPTTLVGLLDRATETAQQLWSGRERTISGIIFPEIAPLGTDPVDFACLCESFFEPPALLAVERSVEREVRRYGSPETDAMVRPLGSGRDFSWTAPDGLEIHGWLVTPPGPGPHPVIVQIHGGPVFCTPPVYVGRVAFQQMALAAGYALFQPNVRGSGGRGQAFARHVYGDMGGGDTLDHLAGLDALEAAGIIDPRRIGVMGGSYGGYMTSWLITQDPRFAAAVPLALTSDWVSDHLTSNVPSFCEAFLADRISNFGGRYFTRSPIHFADRVRTPVLNICGAHDKITHPAQGLEFHQALQGVGVESVLVTYPQEGHGIRTMPAVFDYTARALSWFARHMRASRS